MTENGTELGLPDEALVGPLFDGLRRHTVERDRIVEVHPLRTAGHLAAHIVEDVNEIRDLIAGGSRGLGLRWPAIVASSMEVSLVMTSSAAADSGAIPIGIA